MVCRTCLVLVVYFFLTLPVNANLLINGSFEEPGFGGGFYRYLIDGDTSIAHWTVRDDGIGEMPYWYNFGSPGSPYTNGFDGFYAVSLNIGSSTETATSLVSSTTYRLSFWASHATNDPLAVFAPAESDRRRADENICPAARSAIVYVHRKFYRCKRATSIRQ